MTDETGRTDPRVARTTRALRQAMVELASRRPASRITVAELAERAGVTRATFYHRYSTPLDPLIEELHADLEAGHHLEEQHRAEGWSGAELHRMAIAEVAGHVERFAPVYQQALGEPADRGVFDALVRHFDGYALRFLAHADEDVLPKVDHRLVAHFLAHGFAGAIRAWAGDPSATREDLVAATLACSPAWWAAAARRSGSPRQVQD